MSLPKFIALSFEKANPASQQFLNSTVAPTCVFCEMRIEDRAKGLQLKNCDHAVHKACLEDMFRLKKNSCNICQKTICEGYDKALQIPKIKPNKVTKKKKELEE